MKNFIIINYLLLFFIEGQFSIAQTEMTLSQYPEKIAVIDSLPVLDESANLNTYLEYAALNNPDLKAAYYRWTAAMEKIPQVRSLPDPLFNYGYFIQSVETRVGPQRHRFEIRQTIPWFGKLKSRGGVAEQAANSLWENYEAVKLDLFFAVKKIYYELGYLNRALEVMNENVQLLVYLENVVLSKYRSGIAPHSSLIKAQVELDKLRDRLNSLKDLQRPVKAQMNSLLNRESHALIPKIQKIELDTILFTNTQLIDSLVRNNPQLKSSEFRMNMEKETIHLAKQSYIPDISLGLEYIDIGDALNPNTIDSGKDALIAKVGINLPIWLGRNKAAVNEAKARYVSAKEYQENQQNELVSRLEVVLYQFREAERKLNLYKGLLLPRADQALNVTQSAFESGKVDFLDLIDSQRTYLEFELALERARADYMQRLAELGMLTGKEISKGGK
jgi:outer membrane protein TolC